MTAPAKLAAFAAALAVLFGGGAVAGRAVDPDPRGAAPSAGGHGDAASSAPGHAGDGGPRPVRGLGVAEGGLRLVAEEAELRRGRPQTLRFRVVDDHGRTVRDFDVEHEKRMHLIVARRDLTNFQHLHPEQGSDGSWSVRLVVPAAGSYRVFADFAHEGEPSTLATDLRVDGPADLVALPPAAVTAPAGAGYAVRLAAGGARPGEEADLRFAITRGGAPVEAEPYLGARGHLVALREGDLAFLHVHPAGEGTRFAATFPTAGRYRLFLQFKHAGRVRTAAFTQEVG